MRDHEPEEERRWTPIELWLLGLDEVYVVMPPRRGDVYRWFVGGCENPVEQEGEL